MNYYQTYSTSQHGYRASYNTVDKSKRVPETSTTSQPHILELVDKLCQALTVERITYCHWKSNNALDRSASGDNDLDLLVSRADIRRFTEILYRLGFKQAIAPAEKQMPSVHDFFGYDVAADKLVHVHAHYQLILGHDMTKNYRLPIEREYLESATQDGLFKVPAPEYEFIVFVIRMILKHSTWDAILGREGKLKTAERKELTYLQERINHDRVARILKQDLPYISKELFDNCVAALQPDCSTWTRIKTGHQLQIKLQAHARRSLFADTFLKFRRRVTLAFRRRILKSTPKYRLESGGAMIALVGGDGAGKSTAVDGLYVWLSKYFDTTKTHIGKPPWSWTTKTVRGILKIGSLFGLYPGASSYRETLNQKALVSPGYPWLLREVCTARDRYSTYRNAQRFADNGGLTILDRFPHPLIQIMDGPLAARFIERSMNGTSGTGFMSPNRDSLPVKLLVRREESYYQHFTPPELFIVLRVEPETAVARKTDEDADSVRERSMAMWELKWEETDAHIVDAGKPQTEVLNDLKALIWSEL